MTSKRSADRAERWYVFKHSLVSQLQQQFRASGISYSDLAGRLGWTEEQARNRMTAQCHVKTRWMFEMAWEIGYDIKPILKRIESRQDEER
jgi:hypothetical protein